MLRTLFDLPASAFPQGDGVAWSLRHAARTLQLWAARRQERYDLAGLSDHLLRDIGCSRAEQRAEAAKRFWKR